MSYPGCSDQRVKTNLDLNPDHNIWNNNGTWWLHATVHHPDYTKERVRVSLGTKHREEARQRRDFILRGTAAIASRIPRGQAMPDSATPSVWQESRSSDQSRAATAVH
jgi:hypothetical protein